MSRVWRQMASKEDEPSETLRVSYPESAWLGDADPITWQGTWAGTLVPSWHPVTATDYLFFTQNDGTGRFIGADPGPFEPSLAGMTGREIQLPAGSLSPADVGAAVQTQWNAFGTGVVATHTGGGTVDYVGNFDADAAASAGPGDSWENRGAGTSAYGATELDAAGVSRQDTDWMSWVQVENSALPSVMMRAVGVRFRGENVRMAVALGTVDGNPGGESVQWQALLAGGGSGWHTYYFTPAEVFPIDGTASPRVFLGTDGDSGGASGIFGGPSQNLGLQVTGGNNVFRTGASTGAATPFPATVPALSGGNFNFGLSVQLIVQVGPFYGDGDWQSEAGMDPRIVAVPPNTTTMDQVIPGFGFDFPAVASLEIRDIQLYLGNHDAAPDDQLRVEVWDNPGGLSTTSMAGDTIYSDVGPTSGTDTGWVSVLPARIPVNGGGEYRITLKGEPGGAANDTNFGFTLGGYGDVVEKPAWSLLATMEASEVEYTAANGETSIPFDPQVATPSPMAPNSAAIFPGNSGGLAVRIGHSSGIAMVANP